MALSGLASFSAWAAGMARARHSNAAAARKDRFAFTREHSIQEQGISPETIRPAAGAGNANSLISIA
jgi:hypothetical protein